MGSDDRQSLGVSSASEAGGNGGVPALGRAPSGLLGFVAKRPGLFLLAASALTLGVRALYLARFGWDGGWMNWGYLAHAKTLALQGGVTMEEPALTPLLLVLFRHTGLSSLQAMGALYLVGHLGLALGTFGLATFVWPRASPRRRLILVLVVALTPLLSTVAGYRNLGALVGASGLVCALALALKAAERPRLSLLELGGATFFAVLASTARFEALAGVLCGAVVLLVLGRAFAGVHGARTASIALLVGGLLGAGASAALRRPAGPAQASHNYAFYTFYDGLPYLLWPSFSEDDDEFVRYRTSVQYLGTYAENHGSLVRALVLHPRGAFLRVVAKPVDFLGALGWFGSLTPLGLLLVALGLRKLPWRRQEDGTLARGWALLAYLGPFLMLWVPASAPPYFLTVAPPLLLALTRGLDMTTARLGARTAWLLGVGAVAAALVLIASFGKKDLANSPVFNEVAAYLESRCPTGCLVSFLPQAIRAQAWVELEAGSPFPAGGRSESRVLGESGAEYQRGFDFEERVRRARRAGFQGPVLYVETRASSFQPFHEVFDGELKWQGAVDLTRLQEEKHFERGGDSVNIYVLPPAPVEGR
jgi:hypothetical protein